MSSPTEELPLPDFEIDHPEEFGQYFLGEAGDIEFYLGLLARRRSIVTVYIDEGRHFFLSSVVAVDAAAGLFVLDPAQDSQSNALAVAARQITLVANLDRVKIQVRPAALKLQAYQGQTALCTVPPVRLLRLQRREFFRLELPSDMPLRCRLAVPTGEPPQVQVIELPLADISGGGISLCAATELLEHFPRDALFQDCRLEIPDEAVLAVNLRVRKAIEVSTQRGEHSLRIGCEFINLSGPRLAHIERYIARVERERKARDTGLFGG